MLGIRFKFFFLGPKLILFIPVVSTKYVLLSGVIIARLELRERALFFFINENLVSLCQAINFFYTRYLGNLVRRLVLLG